MWGHLTMACVETPEGGVECTFELPPHIAAYLEQPTCLDIGLPEPKTASLELPTGSTIKGITDITQGIPTDCSLNLSLMLQLTPILANLECFIRLLKLIKPLIDVIKGLPFPPVKAIKDFGEASVDVGECILKLTTPLGIIPFVLSILCLIIRILGCMVDQMQSLLAVVTSLNLQLESAAGNDALLANIACARDNAQKSANSMMLSVEPVLVILELVAPLLEIAQVPALEIPTFGGVEGVEEMQVFLDALSGFRDTLQLVADGLGGCD